MSRLNDYTTITYAQAEARSEKDLKRWLVWAMKGCSPEYQEIIRETSMGNKTEVLNALVWVGAVG